MAERVVDLFEAIDVDKMHGDLAADRRRQGERGVESFNQAGAVGEAGEHVMMGEKLDAPIGLLLFARTQVPGDGRCAKGQSRQQAERDRRGHEIKEEFAALLRFVDESADDCDRPAIGQYRHKGFGKMRGFILRRSRLDVHDGLTEATGTRRFRTELRQIDERDLVVVGDKLRIAVVVEDQVTIDLSGFARGFKERKACA